MAASRARLLFLPLLAACAPAASPPPAADAASAACVAAVADHVGRPPAEVIVEAVSAGEIRVRDGDRVHLCRMQGDSVTAILHPRGGAEGAT